VETVALVLLSNTEVRNISLSGNKYPVIMSIGVERTSNKYPVIILSFLFDSTKGISTTLKKNNFA
jgi:hypothetical protein